MPEANSTPPPAAPARPAWFGSPLQIFGGTSGFGYTSWKPAFYPKTVKPSGFLAHYAERLNSCEINYTFTKLPTREQLLGWLAAVPDGFRFSFKAPQRITHMRRLRECDELVSEFLAAIEPARRARKLGALLFQLPPNFKPAPDRLAALLAHPKLRRGGWPLAFEFRHEGWFTDETYALLRRYNAALCIAHDTGVPTPEVHTATHRYYRLRREGGYTAAAVDRYARQFAQADATGPAYVYFRHEHEPHGALNALRFLSKTGVTARAGNA